jgi:hypothetical protein
MPARLPLSTPAFFTPSFRARADQPIFAEIDTIACQHDPCCPLSSKTSRTPRPGPSAENLFAVLPTMLHPNQPLEPPANKVRFNPRGVRPSDRFERHPPDHPTKPVCKGP